MHHISLLRSIRVKDPVSDQHVYCSYTILCVHSEKGRARAYGSTLSLMFGEYCQSLSDIVSDGKVRLRIV